MAQVVFTFVFNTETQESSFVGNIELPLALQILQGMVIADLVRKAQVAKEQEVKAEEIKAE